MQHYPVRSQTLVAGNPEAGRRILIFHGYTGAPDEFHYLADELAARFDAYVTVPLLPGHGTHEAELAPLRFEDFLAAARTYVDEIVESGKPYIIIGHSFGGYLAAITAASAARAPEALVFSVTPYVLRFPYSLRLTAWLMTWRTFWDKKLPVQEKIARIGLFFYQNMPGVGLQLVQEGNRRMKNALRRLSLPILVIGTDRDPLVHPSTCERILEDSARNDQSLCVALENREHGVFYGEGWKEPIGHIADFFATVINKK